MSSASAAAPMRQPEEVFGPGLSGAAAGALRHLRDALVRTCRPEAAASEAADQELRVAVVDWAEGAPGGWAAPCVTDALVRVPRSWRQAPAQWSAWPAGPRGGSSAYDVVLLNHAAECAWTSAADAADFLRRGRDMLSPRRGACLVGLGTDGAQAHALLEHFGYGDHQVASDVAVRFSATEAWPETGTFGRRFFLALGAAGSSAGRWAFAMDRDDFVRAASAAGLAPAEDAHGLSPTAMWNAQYWHYATGEDWPLETVEALSPGDWHGVLPLFSVFALQRVGDLQHRMER